MQPYKKTSPRPPLTRLRKPFRKRLRTACVIAETFAHTISETIVKTTGKETLAEKSFCARNASVFGGKQYFFGGFPP